MRRERAANSPVRYSLAMTTPRARPSLALIDGGGCISSPPSASASTDARLGLSRQRLRGQPIRGRARM